MGTAKVLGKITLEIRKDGIINLLGNPWFVWEMPDWLVSFVGKIKAKGGKDE